MTVSEFLKKSHLAIEWHSQMMETEYNPKANEIMKHESTLAANIDDQ